MADYDIPVELQYSQEDEWVRPDGDQWVVGVSDYAQDQLGDIVFVELPEVGAAVKRGGAFGVIESVKAVSDLFAPISGTVVAVNAELEDRPEIVNESCYGDGWLIRIEGVDPSEVAALLDANTYRKHVEERSE